MAGLAVLALLSTAPASATTFTVTDPGDSGPNTLREAIAAANSTAGADSINFNLSTLPGTITLTHGELEITEELTITGPGAENLTISGNNASRVFFVAPGVPVNISGLTISGGNGAGTDSGNGGGLYVDDGGTLTFTDSTVSGNTASFNGGGVFLRGTATATLTNTTISGNVAPSYGGGISVDSGATLTLTDSTISGNSTTYFGGGISNAGVLTVTGSTLTGNTGSYGGALQNDGTLTVTNTTVAGNTGFLGGGLRNFGTATMANTTFWGNTASIGGGILNSGVSQVVKNTILANSLRGGNCDGGGTSQDHNLSDDSSCAFLIAPGDLNNFSGDVGLDPAGLADNGGPTRTIALLDGSPAIDAIPTNGPNDCTAADGATAIATDQRGWPRPFPAGGNCDIGAFELQPAVADPPDNHPPVITIVNGPLSGVAVGKSVPVSGDFTDADAGDTHNCTFSWGDGEPDSNFSALPEPAPPAEGVCGANHIYAHSGLYTVEATVTDDKGGNDSMPFQYVAVYDPAGFVTGGGWFQSPAGAVPSSPGAVGKANFSFSAKYQGRSDTLSGQTEFQFQAGSFHSSKYQWLIVSGDRAQLLGMGTVNGQGNYGFLLTATDGALNGDGVDKFRIKIWDMDDGNAIVYDNQPGALDTDPLTTDLGGGSIVVHSK